MCHLSLVEFDDKPPYIPFIILIYSLELLELLNKSLGHLDPIHLSIDIQKET